MSGKLNLLLVLAILLCLGSLYWLSRDFREPNVELVPERQMARSPAFASFTPNPNFPDGITFRQPVPGTIARGKEIFDYGPTPLDAARAAKELVNPLSVGYPLAREQGALLYATYCQFCHGATGNGDGKVSGRGFPAPLSFLKPQAMDMKDGEMFHILTFGKANMPAHAVQLSPADRWAVILHVRVLQNKYTEFPNVRLADTIQLYKTNCAACHGEDGAGTLLRAKFPTYLPDFSSLAWHFSKTNLEITNRIEYGDEPHMPAFRYKLSRDQILGLAIYLRSLAVKRMGTPEPVPPVPLTAAGMQPLQIFRAFCLACHNVDGRGAIVRPGMPDIPDFTVATWHKTKKDADLSKSILSGGKFMPPMKDKLTQADADKMVAFVRAFQDGKQVVKLESEAIPPTEKKVVVSVTDKKGASSDTKALDKKLDVLRSEVKDAQMAQRLRSASVLFREYCIVCHGPDGTGAAAMRPALPSLPDFTKNSFRDQHSDAQLLISILDGKGTLMPANRGRLNESQARDLAAYIRAFAPLASGTASLAPNEFRTQFEQLQREWEGLERDIRALKANPSQP
jgi:mono/diheme cytochrome c family protein